MKKTSIQQILNYYLEYEIHNLISSSKIKVNNKTSLIITDLKDEAEICKKLNILKNIKIKEKIDKFVGKKANNKSDIVELINKELLNFNDKQIDKIQTSFMIKNILQENLQVEINEKTINKFINELFDIILSQEFWLYAHNIAFFNKEVRRLPIFIFKCKIENEKISVIEANINDMTLNTILSIILNKEISDVALEFKEKILNYSKEINESVDAGDIQHILELYYFKLEEYFELSKQEVINISQKKSTYKMNEEYIISLNELIDDGIKNIKEDIELLKKVIDNDNYVPNLLDKYLNGSTNKKDLNDPEYLKMYKGNYKSIYGVGENQYKIINSIKNNDLIAIEGPPGTGKTSLLKEIIANKIVERADLILKNWDKEIKTNKYWGTTYYNIDWYEKDVTTIKSIVVTSKNSEAIENVGQEINQEIKYMFPVARKYQRTEMLRDTKQNILQNYKGLVCLPLGKQDNILDFKKFLYERYIPMLNRLQSKKYSDKIIQKVKKEYKDKHKQIENYEKLIDNLDTIKNKQTYFYGIKIGSQDENEKNKKIEEIQKLFINDKNQTQAELTKLKNNKNSLLEQKKEQEGKLKYSKKSIKNKKDEIEVCKQAIISRNNEIQDLKSSQQSFNNISKNVFTKILNYKEYRKNKNVNFFSQINELEISNKIEEKQISQYIENLNELENKNNEIKFKIDELNEEYSVLKKNIQDKEKRIYEIKLIEKFNNQDKHTFWYYSNIVEMFGKSSLNDLNQELFELALRLNEAYIIKNSEKIIENLKLFLPDDQNNTFVCQKFYDSTDLYSVEKQKGIRCLWNTLFLCFPVVTTTLDSFSKRCFHLIPEYIDLELVDEAGQILTHNFVSAAYRAKKAIIVGDVNQIEPIYNSSISKSFDINEKNIIENFDKIKVDSNSIQSLANKNTDILNNNENIILNDHYRCEKNIINFSNENVYKNKLNMHEKDNFNKLFDNNMIAMDVRGKKTENENILEAESCVEIIKSIKERDKGKTSIAVITPFRKQKERIYEYLDKQGIKDVKVGTVHAFQGKEKDYIIFSSVIDSIEPKWAINFIGKKANMLNVAVTRAKKQFIYLGNLNVAMQAENYITKLIKYIEKNGIIYSLYDMTNVVFDKLDERILKILQPELIPKNDNIGLYVRKNIENGIIIDAKQHYEFFRYVIKNVTKEIYIMSPWLRENVMNEEFFDDIIKLKENNCIVKIVFGYKKGNRNISNADELALELKNTKSLGFSTQEEVKKIAEKMYEIIGKDNFVYAPPTHAKILIIDDKYMCIGSHNWLSNAGKTSEEIRAREGTRITTSKLAIDYTKEKFFQV